MIFDSLLKKSKSFKSLLHLVSLMNTAVSSLTVLCESMVAEIEQQRIMITNLAKLCEMMVQKDPQLQQLLNKVGEKKKDVN